MAPSAKSQSQAPKASAPSKSSSTSTKSPKHVKPSQSSSSSTTPSKKKFTIADAQTTHMGFPVVEFERTTQDAREEARSGMIMNDDVPMKKKKKTGGFQSFSLSTGIFKGIMRAGYKLPTPIQRKAIPIILAGHDIVAMARTGSGKTAAFLIPMFEKLRTHSSKDGVRAVILSPTRELAMQTHKVCKSLGKFTDLRYTLLVGGASMDQQFESLANEPDVIIATPGRLMHHLVEVKFSLQSVQLCIFDEADRLFEMGFAAQLTEILKRMSDTRQTCLFSATLPSQIVEFTRAGLHNPQLVRLDVDKKISPELRITFFTLRKEQKTAALIHILQHIIPQGQQTIVFAATRHHVEFLSQLLTCAGLSATHVYGQLDPAARKINIAKFRLKKANIMIVTDVAARGIDIPLLDNVINYDFPSKPKLFVHRVGRVARAGRSGVAYSLVAPDEMPFMIDLHLFLGRHLINTLPEGTQYDDKQVYYGNMPREILEEQSEYVKSLIEDGKLDRLDQVATRAYTLYYKTRAPPSASSVKRVKEMDPPELHPMFAKDVNETEKAVDNMLEAIRGYKSSQTIFEVLESKQAKSKQSTSIMREKRAIHDATIEAKKRTQALKERSEALRRERGLGHEEANAIAQEEMNQKDGMDDGIGDELYDQDEDDDDEAQDEDGDELPDDEVDMDGMEDEDEQEEEDPEQEDDDGGDELMEETKVAPDTKRGVKRKADTITSTSTSATSTSAATPSSTSTSIPTHKPRLSKRARLAAKTGTDITSTSTSIPTSKKKSSFRDENFFISDQPSDKHTDDGYEINANRLEDSVLGLTGDDAETMMKAQQIEKWDRKKKKFIKETVGGDPFRKQRNEAGVLIRPNKDQPSLYEQWKKKSKRGVRDVIQDDDDEEDGDAPPTKKGKKGSTKRPPKDELKSFDEIAKKRIQDEKNKIKNRPGGFKAFNKENKGKFDKMARSHKGGKNTRWKNSKGNAGRPTKGGKGSFKGSSKGKGRR